MTQETSATLPDGRGSVSSSPPVVAAIDAVLRDGIDAASFMADTSGAAKESHSEKIEDCLGTTEEARREKENGEDDENAVSVETSGAVTKGKEAQDGLPSTAVTKKEQAKSSGSLRVTIKEPHEEQGKGKREEEKTKHEKADGLRTAEFDDADEDEAADEDDGCDLEKQRRRKSYREYFGLDDLGPEEDDDEEDDELALEKQRRRKSYREYFGLDAATEGEEGAAGAGGLSVVANPGAHRKSSLVSIMFDAGRTSHWSDVYQKDRQAQPVVFKRVNVRFESLNSEGAAPDIVGSREVWLAVYNHGNH